VAQFDTAVDVFVWWPKDLWASQTCLSISSGRLDVMVDMIEFGISGKSLHLTLVCWKGCFLEVHRLTLARLYRAIFQVVQAKSFRSIFNQFFSQFSIFIFN
jgi:hypothetical protein